MQSAKIVVTVFTIHSGKIKTPSATPTAQLESEFTIHSGKIKTISRNGQRDGNRAFTFHYGKIKTAQALNVTPSYLNLHSIMVRLKLPPYAESLQV